MATETTEDTEAVATETTEDTEALATEITEDTEAFATEITEVAEGILLRDPWLIPPRRSSCRLSVLYVLCG